MTETTALIARMRADGSLEGREALGELALILAKTLEGDAGLATAAVAREFRATLAELGRDDDGDHDVEQEFRDWMSTEMGDAEGF